MVTLCSLSLSLIFMVSFDKSSTGMIAALGWMIFSFAAFGSPLA